MANQIALPKPLWVVLSTLELEYSVALFSKDGTSITDSARGDWEDWRHIDYEGIRIHRTPACTETEYDKACAMWEGALSLWDAILKG